MIKTEQREDLRLGPLAKRLGWKMRLSGRDKTADVELWQPGDRTPMMPLSFQKSDKWVWRCQQGWRSADLSSANMFTNHQWEADLESALRKY